MLRTALALCAAACCALPAFARNERVLMPAPAALSGARAVLGETAVRIGSASLEEASGIVESTFQAEGVGSFASDAAHGGGRPSDQEVCQSAFANAMAKLVVEANRVGATAIVGVVSDNEQGRFDDPANIECRAGTVHASIRLVASFARSLRASRALPPASGFAALDDVAALPASAEARARYAHFLTLPSPRAFALYEDGHWRFYGKDPEAMTKVLDYCAREGRRCWLYAADDRVVWNADVAQRIGSSSQLAAPSVASNIAPLNAAPSAK